MESSEDDAGNATNASCRASARETDIEQAEDMEPSLDSQHEPPEASASYTTPTMSEDNFDGDSVRSPSPQDVNTSTEAILDMIDEFVDGPGAPKRLPRTAVSLALNATIEPVDSLAKEIKQQTDDSVEQPRTLSPAPVDKSEMANESLPNKFVECTPNIQDSLSASTSSNVASLQKCLVSVDKTETLSNEQTDYNSAVISGEPEPLAMHLVTDLQSSSQAVQNISNISVCEQFEQLERTIKCVTSSDHRDNVTVERAESTSNECSENKGLPLEPLSRSPLKRRLVRPAPSDRRPDSTVSSTEDSSIANIHSTEPSSSGVVIKDVSSSSDAISLHGSVKPEDISKVSDISICKAETSTAPKRFRLIRPKFTPILSNSVQTPEIVPPEKKQCQSTSADDNAPILPVELTNRFVTLHPEECSQSSESEKCVVSNDSVQVSTTLADKRKVQENVNSNIESATPSVSTLPSEPSTNQSVKLKVSDAQEASTQVLTTTIEPSHVQSNIETINILTKKCIPTKSDISIASNSEEVLKPTKPVQLKVESMEAKLSLESSNSNSKKAILKQIEIPTKSQSIEPSEVQSKMLDASHEQPQVYVTQSSTSAQVETVILKLAESQSRLQKPDDVLLTALEKTSECQSKVLKPIKSQSIVMAPISLESENKVPTETPLKILETEIEPKSSPKTLESKMSKLEVLKPAETQPLAQEDGQSKEKPKLLKPTASQLKALELAEKLEPADIESKAPEPAKELKPKSGFKVPEAAEEVEPAKSEFKTLEAAELIKLAESESNLLGATKALEQAERESKTPEPPKVLKQVDSVSKVLKTAEVLKKVESVSKVLETAEVLKPVESESNTLKAAKVLEPAESELKTLKPSKVLTQVKKVSKSLETAQVLKPAGRESKILEISEVQEPVEFEPKTLETEPILKPEECESKAPQPVKELMAVETESNILEPAKKVIPADIKPKALKPAEERNPDESEPRALKLAQVLKPVEQELKGPSHNQTKIMLPTESPVETPKEIKKVAVTSLTELKKTTETQSVLVDQAQSQSEQALAQSNDLKLEIAQLEQTKEKQNELKKTNLHSTEIQHMDVDSDTKELIENKSLDVSKESQPDVCLKESLLIDVDLKSRHQQPIETKSNALDGVKKLPPIKLTLTKVSRAEKKTNDLETQSMSKNTVVSSHQDQHVSASNTDITFNCDSSSESDHNDGMFMDQKKVHPIKLNLSSADKNSSFQSSSQKSSEVEEKPDSTKQVPKLTIKLGNKPAEEMKSPIPKLTIKPIRPPIDQKPEESFENSQPIPNVTKLNIKPIVKPREENDLSAGTDLNDQDNRRERIQNITKLNIKPIPKPAEKINDMHRKSSSSEISESEYSEYDETSTSDQASASDQGPSDTVPKVTIKLGKPGTESEGKFYTEKNIPKLTIKGLQQNENDEKDAKHKLMISQSEDTTLEKVPKLTIKAITKSEGQPLSPKLTIKKIKSPENDNEILKLKITTDAFGSSSEIKENMQVPKITIKAVTKTDSDTNTKSPKKSTLICDSPDHIPVVTKLNIKPILKPMESAESPEEIADKVPVVSKLNIKPIIKPKDHEFNSSVEDVPKIIKLNIKPLKNPEENSAEGKDCDENMVDKVDIPVVTKLNIKPICKPEEDEGLKDSENQSSETSTSSDDNSDHIPVVTKINIKPIVKPSETEEATKPIPNDQDFPVVTKLNIKPLVKPEDSTLPSSPKKDSLKSPSGSGILKTKLNIKPIVKPEDTNENKYDDIMDKSNKNPPLVMKINMKNVCDSMSDQKFNSFVDGTKSPRQPMSPKIKKFTLTPDREQPKSNIELRKNMGSSSDSSNLTYKMVHGSNAHPNYLEEINDLISAKESKSLTIEVKQLPDKTSSKKAGQTSELHEKKTDLVVSPLSPAAAKQKKSLQNCTLLKQLLSNTKDDSEKSREMSMSNCLLKSEKRDSPFTNCNTTTSVKTLVDEIRKTNSDLSIDLGKRSLSSESPNDLSHSYKSLKTRSLQEIRKDANESVTKPLEIVTDKLSNQSSGQDSPRIILKINKTDHGPSSKIITEESHVPKDSPPQNHIENTQEIVPGKQTPKKYYVNSKKKLAADEAVNLTIGKRLRSSRVVETPDKPPAGNRRNAGKRPSVSETSPTPKQETEMSVFDSKRLKLEQLLSVNKGLTITPVASNFTQTLPPKSRMEIKQGERKNHPLLNNDNSKNGNSKLHNILSNLQAKQMQTLQMNEATIMNKDPIIIPDAESNTSTGSSDVLVEISRLENCHPDVQEMIINENADFRDLPTPEEMQQDPLEVDTPKIVEVIEPVSIKAVEVTPTPRKRGRPRKTPLAAVKADKPPTPPLPVSALEERPQRSLRLMRERPEVPVKPRRGRGRGRGRGGYRAASPALAPRPPSDDDSTETVIVIETFDEDEPQRPVTPARPATPEDPTSSRIKLPRMTEALDKSSACMSMTPLSSRRRSPDMKLFGEPSVVIESPVKLEEYMKCPEVKRTRGRGGRGRGTPRGRSPRGRGRGRGGGKGATYMKETMGIYGRVCGPATTTVELFEEETCMMDDNATPSKPSHLLDEDSQSSVKSSTNDSSNRMKKSKFADLFDSNKVWMASDVKEYTWPPPDVPDVEHQVMMIQEQVAMFLGVKSFKRRYSELKRRAVVGEEKDYCLRRGIVTEALCDLGITAVDASDVLDIMLSDYPHKYEEYRSYQRQKQLTGSLEEVDAKLEEKSCKLEIKSEKTSDKPEPPKVDPEKTRQDMAAAAIASAAEWNAIANAWRRGACADLQSNTIHRRRAPAPPAPPARCRPPHGFYPHAVLPGQYQHAYLHYTPEQLRYFPLNTVIAAPPAPASPVESSSESEGSWVDSSTSSDDSHTHHHSAKRKKLTKIKRSSQHDKDREDSRGAPPVEEVVDLCRVCKLRLEANRKYTHERFLVCAHCNAKMHPSCLDLSADTIRKCREYAWQCSECKQCGACQQPGQDKLMYCELCDRGYHAHCVAAPQPTTGRWHCVECSVCKSCGAREPGGLPGASGTPGPSGTPGTSGVGGAPPEWHHQTRRGPGGHKVYSHSLCTPCARAYRIGRYCPLCERSFIGAKGTLQLVICKLCDRQLHQECVKATVTSLNVLDYVCGSCRRGGITSRAGAVRAAPRTIATLFMAKRRFNKYAHRQYMQSRRPPEGHSPTDLD